MTIDYFIQHIADPNQLYSVGSNSGFFFIGTRSEWNKHIDALSRKHLKCLRSRRTTAKKNAKRAQERLNREPIKLICGKDLEGTIAYLNSVVEIGNREYLYFDRLIKAFTPFRTREIKDIYSRMVKADGTNIIVSGLDTGNFWMREEFEDALCLERYEQPKEENMENTVTRIERRSDGSYIVTVNGKNFECEDTQAMLNFLGEVGDAKNEMR